MTYVEMSKWFRAWPIYQFADIMGQFWLNTNISVQVYVLYDTHRYENIGRYINRGFFLHPYTQKKSSMGRGLLCMTNKWKYQLFAV